MRLKRSSVFSKVVLSEGRSNSVPNEVQILRVGVFNHPDYGKFEITPYSLAEMVTNFKNKIRGIDMSFDYYHESGKDASGWVNGLELRENGTELWAVDVDWTPTAEKKLAEKELRYFSPDFAFHWKDPESGKVYNNVLFGGGLTNRPFVKEMRAITADEGNILMDEELKKELLEEGYSEEEIEAALAGEEEIELGGPGSGPRGGGAGSAKAKEERRARVQERLTKSNLEHVARMNKINSAKAIREKQAGNKRESDWLANTKASKKSAKLSEGENMNELQKLQAKIDELQAKNLKLTEDYEAKLATIPAPGASDEVAALKKEIEMLKAELEKAKGASAAMLEEKKMAEKEGQFNLLLSEGKACVAQKESFMKDDMANFIKLAQPVNPKGFGASNTGGAEGDKEDKILKLAETKVKADPKLNMGDAIQLARKELN